MSFHHKLIFALCACMAWGFLNGFIVGCQSAKAARVAKPVPGWICPMVYHGAELGPSRDNIFRGICIRP